MRSILLHGLFEDVFPPAAELRASVQEVRDLNLEALCRRETHHGRRHTEAFCGLEAWAAAASQDRNEQLRVQEATRQYGFWLPERSFHCFWTWLKIAPVDVAWRQTDRSGWAGMPAAMVDRPTVGGECRRTGQTMLFYRYEDHLELARLWREIGWEGIRRRTHAEIVGGSLPLTVLECRPGDRR